MNPVLAAMLGMFLGAILLLAGLFFVHLLKVMKEVRDSVGQFAKVIDPLIKTGALQQLSGASATLVSIGRDVLKAMGPLTSTVNAFNRAFFSKEAMETIERPPVIPPDETAQPGEALGIHYSEEKAAGRETAEELRKSGVETDESRVFVPEQQHGTTV